MYNRSKFLIFNFQFLILTASFIVFPHKVEAQVVINEINASEEWVEFYKSTPDALSLDGCTIYFQDTKSQDKLLTATDNFQEGENYKVILTEGSYLNNSDPDTVSLECPTFSLDPVTYDDNLGTKSYARIPNGTGSFSSTTQITQGSQNPDPTPIPTASPTPVAATQQPVTSAPTSSPRPTPTRTATPKSSPTPSPSNEPEETSEPAETLGLSVGDDKTATPKSIVAGDSTEKKPPILAIVFIVAGVGCLGYVGYLLYNSRHAKTPEIS